jgi:hypothetical protein
MFLDNEYRIAQERRRDRLAWAAKERLIRNTLTRRSALQVRYQRWLARFGARLVRWGSHLQARYADTFAASTVRQEYCGIESTARPLASQ